MRGDPCAISMLFVELSEGLDPSAPLHCDTHVVGLHVCTYGLVVRHVKRQIDRNGPTSRGKQTQAQTDSKAGMWRDRLPDRIRQTDGQTNETIIERQIDWWTDRHTNRLTDCRPTRPECESGGWAGSWCGPWSNKHGWQVGNERGFVGGWSRWRRSRWTRY